MFKELAVIVVGLLTWMSFCLTAVAADAAPGTKKETARQGETKPPAASGAQRRSGASGDARHCLDLPTYFAIIKCAEKYL